MITSIEHLKPRNKTKTPKKSNKTMNPSFPYLERATKGNFEYEQRSTTAPRAI